MSNIRICAINFFDQATLVESPALLATLPATNAQLVARDKSARSTSAAAQTIRGHWGGATRKIDSFFIFRHNGQGGSVQLKLYPNADYTGTAYDSTALPLFTAITSNSYDWGMPASAPNSANDLLGSEAPYYLFFTNFTAKSFEIIFTNCQRSYWDIGRICLGKFLEAPYNPQYGMSIVEKTNDLQSRTKGGSLRTRAGEKWRELTVDMFYGTDADRALWRDLMSYVQLSSDIVVSVFPGSGGRNERDHVMNMQLLEPSRFVWDNPAYNHISYSFTET